jgi:hypothetical protein
MLAYEIVLYLLKSWTLSNTNALMYKLWAQTDISRELAGSRARISWMGMLGAQAASWTLLQPHAHTNKTYQDIHVNNRTHFRKNCLNFLPII